MYKTNPAAGTIVSIKIHATVESILLRSLNIRFSMTKKLIIYIAVTANWYEKISDKILIAPSQIYFYQTNNYINYNKKEYFSLYKNPLIKNKRV
ncbi:hypothetical protein GCM10008917_25130 [Paraclostridium tenue]|uniref:Uncharacterized protein n=1 Tax=Paraclostridium tenue TaxID=1737 RepID=A0ABN1M985_9FIRM